GVLRRAGQYAGGVRLRLVRTDYRRPDGLLRGAVPSRGRFDGDAGQGEPVSQGDRVLQESRRLLPRFHRRPGGAARPGPHPQGGGPAISGAGDGSRVAHRGRELPGVRRDRRQGQRLLRRNFPTCAADLVRSLSTVLLPHVGHLMREQHSPLASADQRGTFTSFSSRTTFRSSSGWLSWTATGG